MLLLSYQQNKIQLVLLSNHKAILSHSLYGVQFLQQVGGETDKTSSYCSSDFCPKQVRVLNTTRGKMVCAHLMR